MEMGTHTEQRWVLRRAECQSVWGIIIIYYYYTILSLLYLFPLPCYRYHLFATATKIPRVDFSSFRLASPA